MGIPPFFTLIHIYRLLYDVSNEKTNSTLSGGSYKSIYCSLCRNAEVVRKDPGRSMSVLIKYHVGDDLSHLNQCP